MTERLVEALQATLAPDMAVQEQARVYFDSMKAQPESRMQLMVALSDQLASTATPGDVKQAAGIQLKNCLTSRTAAVSDELAAIWLSFPEEARTHIKGQTMNALGLETGPSQAARVLATITGLEVSHGQVQQGQAVFQELLRRIEAAGNPTPANAGMLVASLQAVGYTSEAIEDPELLRDYTDKMLGILTNYMNTELDPRLQQAACRAMFDSLEFCRKNFDEKPERDAILSRICGCCQSQDSDVRVTALECLVKVVQLYYQHLKIYIEAAIFEITMRAMKSEEQAEAQQGVEFWTTMCEVEIDLQEEARFYEGRQLPPGTVVHRCENMVAQALTHLCAVLFALLTQQDEHDDDNWNLAKSATVCLTLVASCVGNLVLQPVVDFVRDNLLHQQDWRFRDAAIMAFGSVLEGPSVTDLSTLVDNAIPPVCKLLMDDPSPVVRDSAAWMLGRVCDLMPLVALDASKRDGILMALGSSLRAAPRVAKQACWALSALVETAVAVAYEKATEPVINAHFGTIVTELWLAASRDDAEEFNLRGAAYESLSTCVENTPDAKACREVIVQLLGEVIGRLQRTLQEPGGDAKAIMETQSYLCILLHSLLPQVGDEAAKKFGPGIIEIVLAMFQSSSGQAVNVQEDAFLVISHLIEGMGPGFEQYYPQFEPYILHCLANPEETEVCLIAINVVGALCRVFKERSSGFSDKVVQALIAVCDRRDLDDSLKPEVLSAFADLGIALGPQFERYLEYAMKYLVDAMQACAAIPDEYATDLDYIDHINALRESCLVGAASIIGGMGINLENRQAAVNHNSEGVKRVKVYIPPVVDFLKQLVTPPPEKCFFTADVIGHALGLLGDMAKTIGPQIKEVVGQPLLREYERRAREAQNNAVNIQLQFCNGEYGRLV